MTLKLALRLACSIACVGAHAQTPAPQDVVKVVSVTAGPDTVPMVSVRVHNKSGKDITHLSGFLTYTPYGLKPVQIRCSKSVLDHYAKVTHPLTRGDVKKNVDKAKAEGKKPDLETLNKDEDLTFNCPTRPTKIQQGTASFSPDTVIFADQTWSGDQATAMSEFRQRKQMAAEYGKLMAAVLDAEKAPDPLKRYQEILDGDPTFVHYKLQNYVSEYKQFAREKAALAAHPGVKITPSLDEQLRMQIDWLKRRDTAIGAAYHQHSEPK